MINIHIKLFFVFILLAAAGFAEDFAETKKKAEAGDAAAQLALGLMYANGEGVPKDLVQAHVWWNIAGAKGSKNAKTNLVNVEKQMTLEQKAEAMKLARQLFAELPKVVFDRRPVAIFQPQPIFPHEMSKAGIAGEVIVFLTIGTDGNAHNIGIVRSSREEFEEPAMQAVSQWKFKPGMKNSKPIDVKIQQLIEFDYEDTK